MKPLRKECQENVVDKENEMISEAKCEGNEKRQQTKLFGYHVDEQEGCSRSEEDEEQAHGSLYLSIQRDHVLQWLNNLILVELEGEHHLLVDSNPVSSGQCSMHDEIELIHFQPENLPTGHHHNDHEGGVGQKENVEEEKGVVEHHQRQL